MQAYLKKKGENSVVGSSLSFSIFSTFLLNILMEKQPANPESYFDGIMNMKTCRKQDLFTVSLYSFLTEAQRVNHFFGVPSREKDPELQMHRPVLCVEYTFKDQSLIFFYVVFYVQITCILTLKMTLCALLM